MLKRAPFLIVSSILIASLVTAGCGNSPDESSVPSNSAGSDARGGQSNSAPIGGSRSSTSTGGASSVTTGGVSSSTVSTGGRASGGNSSGGSQSGGTPTGGVGGSVSVGGTTSNPGSAIIINHTNTDASVIPITYLERARALDVVFQHKSVGTDITDGIKALATQDPARYGVNVVGWPYWWTDDQGGHDGVPPEASWFATHDGIASWENGTSGIASTKTTAFDALIRGGYGDVVQVALMKFCFNEVWSGTGAETWDLYRPVMAGLIRDYPNVTFVWLTMPAAWVAGASDTNDYGRPTYDFNNLLRAHIAENGGYLYDIADIETYSRDGSPSFDSADYPAVSRDWAAGADDPHLSAAGGVRAANAWWHLMARIAGWSP